MPQLEKTGNGRYVTYILILMHLLVHAFVLQSLPDCLHGVPLHRLGKLLSLVAACIQTWNLYLL